MTGPTTTRRIEVVTNIALTVVAMTVLSLVLWDRFEGGGRARSGSMLLPDTPLTLEGAYLIGSSQASVVVIEYADFECGYCGRFSAEVLPTIKRNYIEPGHVQLAFRHYPLPIHARARALAVAAECAGEQGRLWEMHDSVFASQSPSESFDLTEVVESLELDSRRFQECTMPGGSASAKVDAEVALARQLPIGGTPTFFIGVRQPDGTVRATQKISGFVSASKFSAALEEVASAGRTD